jgi:hypothetical protein
LAAGEICESLRQGAFATAGNAHDDEEGRGHLLSG